MGTERESDVGEKEKKNLIGAGSLGEALNWDSLEMVWLGRELEEPCGFGVYHR